MKEPCQCVIVLGRNRVKLVVVATRPGKGESEKCFTNGVDLFVYDVSLFFVLVLLGKDLGSDGELSCRG